jgi:hypothetical protein
MQTGIKNVEWRTILKAAMFTLLLNLLYAVLLPRGVVGFLSLITAITLGAVLSKKMRAAHGVLTLVCSLAIPFVVVSAFAAAASVFSR